MNIAITQEFSKALDILEKTNENIFITGQAGTGKSTLLREFVETTQKKYVILAPTGVAALNVGGQTIHSFFRIKPGKIDIPNLKKDFRTKLFGSLDTVIIDEISMVRSDLMHAVDTLLRKNRNKPDEPFGGVQMVFFGDLLQLPPVTRDEEKRYIIDTYGGEQFYDAPVFKSLGYHFVELTQIFRQSESEVKFKELLGKIRTNTVSDEDMITLNSRLKSRVGEPDFATFLTSRRNIAASINQQKLEQIKGREYSFTGKLKGKYAKFVDLESSQLENKLPAPYNLKLRVGAQIMMLRNDPSNRWVNGTICKVADIQDGDIYVEIDGEEHIVTPESWKEVSFEHNRETNQIEEKVTAEFIQFPIQLAYAITIHKSQGKTFDNIIIDVGKGAFAHGQVYVALSRCRTFNGVVLNSPIQKSDIFINPSVADYYKKMR